MKYKYQTLSVLLSLSLFILIFYSAENISCQIPIENNTVLMDVARIPFPNIVINDDGDWSTYGINGSGSLADPYLIENFEIITSASYGIFIIDTTKAFLIKNCYVSSNIDGIVVRNTTSGAVRIEECIIKNVGQDGIKAYKSPNATIIYNQFDNGGTWGTAIEHTGNFSTIAHNTITDYDMGITISKGYTEVFNNTVVSVQRTAIYAGDGDSYLIYNNTCKFNENGIYVIDSSNSVVYNNTCSFNNGNGIRLDISYFCEVKYNWFEANDEFGVVLAYQSSNNIIHHNAFIDNGQGLSQAFEGPTNSSVNNLWYDPVALEGNYWSNWDGKGPYDIGGTTSADLYPLDNYEGLPEIYEYTKSNNFSLIVLALSIVPIVFLLRKKRR